MKRCPECRRDYYDDTLSFCLDDGTALLEGPALIDEPATAVFSAPPSGGLRADERTQQFTGDVGRTQPLEGTSQSVTTARAPRTLDKRLLVAPVILAFIVIGGFVGYRYLNDAGSDQIRSIAVLPFLPGRVVTNAAAT